MSKVTFATSCWEKDWKLILLSPDYLSRLQIGNHQYPFKEKLIIINNVDDVELVKKAAQKKVDEGVLTRYVVVEDRFDFFGLKRSEFNDWQYWNALAPLNAIFEARSEYLLYLTGDVYLEKPVRWIHWATKFMEKRSSIKCANLTWNGKKEEVEKESYRRTWNFAISKEGFSDQMFLVRTDDFKAPIYSEVRADADHYPRGDVFEKRVFSYMKNRGWERITFRRGSYTHENV